MKPAIVLLFWVSVVITLAIAESHKDCEHRGGIVPCGLSRTIEQLLNTGNAKP
jgi:hypothetical protein